MSIEKEAGLAAGAMSAAKGLLGATANLGKNTKGLYKGVSNVVGKNAGNGIGHTAGKIINNNGIRNAAGNISKGLVLPGAAIGAVGAGARAFNNKEAMEENEMIEVTAFDVVNESFDKMAEESEKLDTKKRFWDDRMAPGIGLTMAPVVGSAIGGAIGNKLGMRAVGAQVGGIGASVGAIKAMQSKMKDRGYGEATMGDTAKSLVLNPLTLGLGFTPQTIAKDKERKRQEKSAFDVVFESFEKMAATETIDMKDHQKKYDKAFKNAGIKGQDAYKNQAKDKAKQANKMVMNGRASQAKNFMKNNKGKLGAGLAAGAALAGGAAYLASKREKTAFDVVYDSFEKIAKDRYAQGRVGTNQSVNVKVRESNGKYFIGKKEISKEKVDALNAKNMGKSLRNESLSGKTYTPAQKPSPKDFAGVKNIPSYKKSPSKALQFAKNNKGKLGAGLAAGTALAIGAKALSKKDQIEKAAFEMTF